MNNDIMNTTTLNNTLETVRLPELSEGSMLGAIAEYFREKVRNSLLYATAFMPATTNIIGPVLGNANSNAAQDVPELMTPHATRTLWCGHKEFQHGYDYFKAGEVSDRAEIRIHPTLQLTTVTLAYGGGIFVEATANNLALQEDCLSDLALRMAEGSIDAVDLGKVKVSFYDLVPHSGSMSLSIMGRDLAFTSWDFNPVTQRIEGLIDLPDLSSQDTTELVQTLKESRYLRLKGTATVPGILNDSFTGELVLGNDFLSKFIKKLNHYRTNHGGSVEISGADLGAMTMELLAEGTLKANATSWAILEEGMKRIGFFQGVIARLLEQGYLRERQVDKELHEQHPDLVNPGTTTSTEVGSNGSQVSTGDESSTQGSRGSSSSSGSDLGISVPFGVGVDADASATSTKDEWEQEAFENRHFEITNKTSEEMRSQTQDGATPGTIESMNEAGNDVVTDFHYVVDLAVVRNAVHKDIPYNVIPSSVDLNKQCKASADERREAILALEDEIRTQQLAMRVEALRAEIRTKIKNHGWLPAQSQSLRDAGEISTAWCDEAPDLQLTNLNTLNQELEELVNMKLSLTDTTLHLTHRRTLPGGGNADSGYVKFTNTMRIQNGFARESDSSITTLEAWERYQNLPKKYLSGDSVTDDPSKADNLDIVTTGLGRRTITLVLELDYRESNRLDSQINARHQVEIAWYETAQKEIERRKWAGEDLRTPLIIQLGRMTYVYDGPASRSYDSGLEGEIIVIIFPEFD